MQQLNLDYVGHEVESKETQGVRGDRRCQWMGDEEEDSVDSVRRRGSIGGRASLLGA